LLDTAVDEGAPELYERVGFKLVRVIPTTITSHTGGLTADGFYWNGCNPNTLPRSRGIVRLHAGAADQRRRLTLATAISIGGIRGS